MNKGIFALAMGTFSLGITEFMMMGILSVLAADLGVNISTAGHLISAYATGVCVGAPLLLFARRLSLKAILIVLASLIAFGNGLAALAPEYNTLLAARFISGLPHGAFFGVGAIVARKLARPGHETSAVAFMIAGMTVATLFGVPAGTFIAENLSWRWSFAIVALCGLATLAGVIFMVPRLSALPDRGFKGQFAFLRTLAPWLIFGGVIFGQIGMYSWYSYIDPQMLHEAHFAPADLSWIMVLAGLGMFVGNLVSGRMADRYRPSWVSAWVMGMGIPVLILFYFLCPYKAPALVLMMAGTAVLFGSGSPLQSSIVGYSKGGELLGGACIQIAYNAGNAIAAWLGGLVIAGGHSYASTSLLGIPFVALGTTLLAVLYRRYERP